MSSADASATIATMSSASLELARAVFDGLPYRVHTPRLEPHARAPLILFLHGAGERGDDNAAHVSYESFRNPTSLFFRDAFVLAPQCPANDQWTSVATWRAPEPPAAQPTRALGKALALLADFTARNPVDPARVYVTGMSMGGYGALDAVWRQPKTFAAATIVCGAAHPALAAGVKDVPLLFAHGAQDPLIPIALMRTLVKALLAQGAAPRTVEYATGGHGVWDRAYTDPDLTQWLFTQRRS